MNRKIIKDYIDSNKIKAVEKFEDPDIKYNDIIVQHRTINKITGDEEVVRAYLLSKLTNELGYKLENIELEKEYDIGRPKVNKPRIDVIVRDKDNDAFLYVELKSPDEYEKNQDEIIEKQLFNLASQEKGQGKNVKYLVLYACDINDYNEIVDKCMIIDYEKYNNFEKWKAERVYSEELPIDYGKVQKEPYVKGGKKDLLNTYDHKTLDSIRDNLHNVLWGGGSTDDNEVFSALTNIILAKIQDENEKSKGQEYDFQVKYFENDKGEEETEKNEELFERINDLYRKALKQRLYINDEDRIKKSYVIDTNKFTLDKLRYTVATLERYSFKDGKGSLDGKDILGDFFEGIIRTGFKQSKGQFFTSVNIVRFMLYGLSVDKLAIDKINDSLELPYMIDPSAGSGTFLIEYMKFITEQIKRENRHKLKDNDDVKLKLASWFPDFKENSWAQQYIYGIETNFNLGTATKVNMILHGDGSTNIFVKDGLLDFKQYKKETAPNALNNIQIDSLYKDKEVNNQFDIIMTNPPFSVELDNTTKQSLGKNFIFGDKKNSENLFIERYYQLLREKGRLAVILPESVFDTTENKYIRLFIYKYFNVKAVVSLPQITFAPYTNTKTSILFAQKKTQEEIKQWNSIWEKYSKEYLSLKTRVENLVDVYKGIKNKEKLPSIKDLSKAEERKILERLLKNYIEEKDSGLSNEELIEKYVDELIELCKFDKDTKDEFGFVNTWWVFGEVAKELDYNIFMAETDMIGYKRTLRGEKVTQNDLYRTDENDKIIVDDGDEKAIVDYMRKSIKWE